MLKITNLSAPILYLASVVVMLLFFALAFLKLPPQLPLFYSLPNGTEQVIDTWLIITVPIISLLCVAINTVITSKLLRNNSFTVDVGRIANLTIMVISTYIFIKIIVLVSF